MTITFNKNFYKLAVLKRAIQAYRGLADFKIKKEKNNYRVVLEGINSEVKANIGDEFSNYVLAEMKNDWKKTRDKTKSRKSRFLSV